ncbi:MAG: GapR family DNA-binding domain-containing protein [Vulcanimicrobiota bacterium]
MRYESFPPEMLKDKENLEKLMAVVLRNQLADQLRTYLRTLEQLEQEKQEISSAIKETMEEAKREGLDVKTIRRIVKLRKQGRDCFEEEESTLNTYLTALGMR